MMRFFASLSLVLSLVFILQSCDFQTFEGPMTQETRSVGKYEAIHVKNAIDVKIDPQMGSEIRINAPEDAMKHIEARVEGQELVIDLDVNAIMGDNDIEVRIGEDRLNSVKVSGSGSFSGDLTAKKALTLKVSGSGEIEVSADVENVYGHISGSGDIFCRGSTREVEGRIEGSGDIDFSSLKAENAKATISGSGDIDIYATEFLEARISGSGDISYSGNPKEVDQSVSGSGDIRARQ